MSILSCSPLSPMVEEKGFPKGSPTFSVLLGPLEACLPYLTPLESGSNKPLTYTFAHLSACGHAQAGQIRGLVYYHTETCTPACRAERGAGRSAQDLLFAARCDGFVNRLLVPPSGLGKSTFYEANASRGSTQMIELVDLSACNAQAGRLSKKASKCVGRSYAELGHLVVIDGSLIGACLSMTWADYLGDVRKAKMHLGLDLSGSIPRKMILTEGRGAERPFVSHLLKEGETGVLDRGYQDHQRFDAWIAEGKHIVVRLKKNTKWEVIEALPFEKGTSIFFFSKVLLGDPVHRMTHPVYLIGFESRGKTYWIATDREDLTAEQIAFIFSLRWQVETFFAWWKKHLKVYHLTCLCVARLPARSAQAGRQVSRNPHGVLVQLLSGLITYLLLVIYFHQRYGQRPCVKYLRQLRWDIRHETQPPTLVHIYLVIQTCLRRSAAGRQIRGYLH